MARFGTLLIAVSLIAATVGCPSPAAEYQLSISSTEGGSVTAPGEGTYTYDEGASVSLEALPDSGYFFAGWTGDVGTTGHFRAASTTITVNGDYSITANFESVLPTDYGLTVSSTTGGSVTTPGQGTCMYERGTVVSLVAVADKGYVFAGWTGDVSSVTDVNAASTSITVDGSCSITANFGTGIYDWYDLDAIRENLNGSYVLMNDLDSATTGYAQLASQTANQGKGWGPIGASDYHFAGNLYGRGHEIRDLFIFRPDEDHVGLLGYVTGVVDRLGVVNAYVTGQGGVGGLGGILVSGTVSDSYCTGRITGSGDVGGLVGWNEGNVSYSYSTASVTGGSNVGGLVGWSYGAIVDNCHSVGTVTGDWQVGGLVGENHHGIVSDSYSISNVTGHHSVGGLLGHHEYDGTVRNSYYSYDDVLINGTNTITIGALFSQDFTEWLANDKFLDVNERLSQENGYYVIDDVSDFEQLLAFGQDDSLRFRLRSDLDLAAERNLYIPYLAGVFDGDGYEISNLTLDLDCVANIGLFGYVASYGTVSEIGAKNVDIVGCVCVGGLVGWNAGTVADSYATGDVTGRGAVGGLIGSNPMSTLKDSYFAGTVSGGAPGGLVGGQSGIVRNSHYDYDRVLINGANVITVGALICEDFEQWFANGKFLDVSERLSQDESHYVIKDAEDFKQLLAFGQDASLRFRLEDDLDLGSEEGFYVPYLAAEFDGNGHSVSNLTLHLGSVSNVGLFGFVDSGGRVSDVRLEKAEVRSESGGVGGLVGWNLGTVSDSCCTGSVIVGGGDVGGLVGFNGGTVQKSYWTGSMTGGGSVGGLIGRNWHGTVTNSYSIGNVTGGDEVGGLIGWNKGVVSKSYSTCRVVGAHGIGGLVGTCEPDRWGNGYVSQSFWDVEASGTELSCGGRGKTTPEMRNIVTFLGALWDIAAVGAGETDLDYTWNIVDGEAYPFLSCQSVSQHHSG